MATEFYRYAERTADSAINWADIGLNLTKTFEEEVKLREEKKAAIDQATNKTLENLANAPRGEADDGNNFTVNYSHDATQSLLMQNRLLKAGKLAPKDYVLFNNNLNSGTNQLFNLQKEYQKQFARKMERMKSEDPKTRSQALEGDYAAHLEKFGDLSASKAIIDPLTGRVNVGIMQDGPDGVKVLSKNTMSVADVYKGLTQDFNYFDTLDATGTIASKLAPVIIETIKSEGSIGTKGKKQTVDNALQKANTVKALDDAMESLMVNPYNISSVLTDSIKVADDGMPYHNVFSEEEKAKDPKHAILWKTDKYGTPSTEFSKEQKQAVKDYLLTQAKAQVHEKVSTDVFESAKEEAARIDIARQNAKTQQDEFKLKKKIAEQTDTDIFTPFSNFLDNQWNNLVRKADKETVDYTNKDQTLNQLNKAYSGIGYTFSADKEDPKKLIISRTATDDKGMSKEVTIATVPFEKGARNNIKKAIITDKASDPAGAKQLLYLYGTGAFNEVTPAPVSQQNTNDDPLGIR